MLLNRPPFRTLFPPESPAQSLSCCHRECICAETVTAVIRDGGQCFIDLAPMNRWLQAPRFFAPAKWRLCGGDGINQRCWFQLQGGATVPALAPPPVPLSSRAPSELVQALAEQGRTGTQVPLQPLRAQGRSCRPLLPSLFLGIPRWVGGRGDTPFKEPLSLLDLGQGRQGLVL